MTKQKYERLIELAEGKVEPLNDDERTYLVFYKIGAAGTALMDALINTAALDTVPEGSMDMVLLGYAYGQAVLDRKLGISHLDKVDDQLPN